MRGLFVVMLVHSPFFSSCLKDPLTSILSPRGEEEEHASNGIFSFCPW